MCINPLLWNYFHLFVPSAQTIGINGPHGRSAFPERPRRIHDVAVLWRLQSQTQTECFKFAKQITFLLKRHTTLENEKTGYFLGCQLTVCGQSRVFSINSVSGSLSTILSRKCSTPVFLNGNMASSFLYSLWLIIW